MHAHIYTQPHTYKNTLSLYLYLYLYLYLSPSHAHVVKSTRTHTTHLLTTEAHTQTNISLETTYDTTAMRQREGEFCAL